MFSNNKSKYGFRAAWSSIIGNLLLFFIKYWAGVSSHSIALIADAWHTLSDSISSIVVLFGFKVSNKDKNEKRPFGYGRAELIASIIVGTLLIVVGVEFMKDSIEKLIDRETANYGTFAIIVTVISVVSKEIMARYSFYASKKTNSKSLKADAWHHRSDSISSVVILIGIFFGEYYWWIDSLLGALVSLLIFYTAYEILMESMSPLIGEDAQNHIVEKIHEYAIECYGKDMSIHHIHTHTYGDHVELTFHMVFPKNTSIEKAHDDATLLENIIFERLGIHTTIHMEPDNDTVDIE